MMDGADGEKIYFEDLAEGEIFTAGPIVVTAERLKAFALEFDPQAQHIDEELARGSAFGELVASGWQTASIGMRLLHEAIICRFGGGMGLGVDHLRWLVPVRPNDALTGQITVGSLRVSQSKPGFGIAALQVKLFNQNNEPVLQMTTNSLVRRRPG
jgi:acyl dehydratase